MFERQTGVYIGSKIPQLHRNGNYLNSSDFVRESIKERSFNGKPAFCVNKTSPRKLVIAMKENKSTQQINNFICRMDKELVEDKYSVTWQIGQNVLGRIYNEKHRKRSEIQERPNKPFKDALKEKFDGGGF